MNDESKQHELAESAEYETQEDYAEMQAERLQIFASRLSRLASEQSGKRQTIETRWLDDIRQYHGEYAPDDRAKLARAGGSEIFVNITRNKTLAAEARLQDMLFPTDDKNWGIKPTPVPELDKIKPGTMGQDQMGNQVDLGKMADQVMQEAVEASEGMEKEIDDQLNESRYQAKARDIIHDACQLGTGIVKGPVIVGRTRKRWDTLQDGTSVLQIVEALEPSVERVDPWDFFPDMSAKTIDEAEFVLERRRLSKKQLREFAKLPGVMLDHVRELLRGEAKETHIARDHLNDIRGITGVSSVGAGNLYEVWEYHGPISKAELIDAMEMSGEGMDEYEIDELDDEIEGIVFFSGNHVLRVQLNTLDTSERPYAVFNWEKDDSTIFGFGVPYLMRQPQRVINASWRMMMDNSGMSVADQVVVNRELVTPADGDWRLGPKKLWFLKDKTRSVNEAFSTFSTPSHQQELANIFQMSRQLADEETNLPLIAQGEQAAHVTRTSSGMAMLMNSANIVLRRAVKNWDDDVTRPLITRFYDWNMQYSEDSAIKGDYTIDARGSGALLVREKQQENLMIYANISAGNQELAMRRDWAGLDKEIAKSLEVPYFNITKTDAEIEEAKQQMQAAAQQQGMDPTAQLKQMELQIKQASVQGDIQEAQSKAQMAQAELQARMQLEQMKLQQERELRMAEMQMKYNVTQQQLQTKAGIDSAKIQTDREKAAGDLAIKRATSQMQAQNIANKFDTF